MRDDHPHNSLPPGVQRTASGAPGTDRNHRHARADFLRAILSCIARRGWRAWGCIRTTMEQQAARQELSVLSMRELKDLGLARSDLDAVASGAYFTDPTRSARSRERARHAGLGPEA